MADPIEIKTPVTNTFEVYAPVRNTINKALCVVVKVAGDNITVQPLTGDRVTFRAQYLAPATETETAALRDLVTRLKLDEENREKAKYLKVDPICRKHKGGYRPLFPENFLFSCA